MIDNDLDASARPSIEAICSAFRWPLIYEVEPQSGISFARNRSVQAALVGGADFVAFLDDDEIADPQWLSRLLAAQQRYGAEVVSGPVLPKYDPGVAGWVLRGRFFERPRHPTGTLLNCARTGNCLISCSLFAGWSMPFDPAFAMVGGSDTHFFRRVHLEGATIVWADDAIVYERVPTSRATARWLLQRAYRGGACFAFSERLRPRAHSWIPVRLFTGLARSVIGLVLLLPSVLLGKAGVVRALQIACVGAGLLGGTCGLLYREYVVVHGE